MEPQFIEIPEDEYNALQDENQALRFKYDKLWDEAHAIRLKRDEFYGLLYESLVKFTTYQEAGFKSAPVYLMQRIDAAITGVIDTPTTSAE